MKKTRENGNGEEEKFLWKGPIRKHLTSFRGREK